MMVRRSLSCGHQQVLLHKNTLLLLCLSKLLRFSFQYMIPLVNTNNHRTRFRGQLTSTSCQELIISQLLFRPG